MPRVVSIYFPELAIERIRRADGRGEFANDCPLVVVARSGSKRWVAAADQLARSAGLRVNMPAAKAQAIVRGLQMVEADPKADAAALERLTLWALTQYSPIVAMDATDGIVMDTEGADHLQGGEALMLSGIINRFYGRGLTARVAIADTWGAAHALARVGPETVIVPCGETKRFVEQLPISLLRLPNTIVTSLRTLGFVTVGELSATPRAPLALRLGPEIGRRLDQMLGHAPEPIDPIRPVDSIEVFRAFAEPIGASETIAKYVSRLVVQLCEVLEKKGLGLRRADLIAQTVDNKLQAIRAGTAKPARDIAWLTKLFKDRVEKIDPGFGIEKLSLAAIITEPLIETQRVSSLIEEEVVDIAPLVDIIGNRGLKVYRLAPVASDVPERSVGRVAAMAPELGASWALHWQRPVRLLARPERIEVIALLPDHPPVSITWRGKRRRVKRADGPERIFGEWWTRTAEFDAVRDYFIIEDDSGERFWIFRSGDGVDTVTGSHQWFLHGLFA